MKMPFVLALAWIGTLFVLLASVGVLRMPDLFLRMHAATKAATLGAVCLVVAAGAYFGEASVWLHAGILVVFLFITAPIAAHLIARAAYVTGVKLSERTQVEKGTPLDQQ